MIDLLERVPDPVPPILVPPVDAPIPTEFKRFDPTILDYKIKRAGTFGGLSVAPML